jgi:hypothetical protein
MTLNDSEAVERSCRQALVEHLFEEPRSHLALLITNEIDDPVSSFGPRPPSSTGRMET